MPLVSTGSLGYPAVYANYFYAHIYIQKWYIYTFGLVALHSPLCLRFGVNFVVGKKIVFFSFWFLKFFLLLCKSLCNYLTIKIMVYMKVTKYNCFYVFLVCNLLMFLVWQIYEIATIGNFQLLTNLHLSLTVLTTISNHANIILFKYYKSSIRLK